MAINGGYKIINLGGKEFTIEEAQTCAGIFDQLENTNRAILVSGLTVGSIEIDDFFADVTISGQDYILRGNGYELNITADDEVTCHTVASDPSDVMTEGTYLLQMEKTETGTTKRWLGFPSLPSENGTYTLTCTVTDGIPLLSWAE